MQTGPTGERQGRSKQEVSCGTTSYFNEVQMPLWGALLLAHYLSEVTTKYSAVPFVTKFGLQAGRR